MSALSEFFLEFFLVLLAQFREMKGHIVTLCPLSTIDASQLQWRPSRSPVEAPLSTPIPTATDIISTEDFVTVVIFKQIPWLRTDG